MILKGFDPNFFEPSATAKIQALGPDIEIYQGDMIINDESKNICGVWHVCFKCELWWNNVLLEINQMEMLFSDATLTTFNQREVRPTISLCTLKYR